jgi:hypothetical protein
MSLMEKRLLTPAFSESNNRFKFIPQRAKKLARVCCGNHAKTEYNKATTLAAESLKRKQFCRN